ncbi:MAG TPA: glycosyltransferase family 4 protein, partial [Thermoanaerobaculia bacterium]|nr:glycosyltransferase family 4 protein [Thermoanaerobaculia bacterium]
NYELADLPHTFKVEPILELWDAKPSGRLSMTPWAIAWRKLRRAGRALRHYQQWLAQIRRVAELKPDVVLLGDIRFPFDLFPLMLLRRKSRKLVDICHNVHPFATGGGVFDRSRWRELFYRRIYHLFDRVIVHYQRNRAEFRQSFGVPDERIVVIVHGNEAIFRDLRRPGFDGPAMRRRLGIGDEPVILFFGTLSRYKGIDILLEAFPEIHRATDARLVVAGFPGPDFDLPAHQQRARALDVENAVTWVPEYVDSGEVAAWMELTSVIVFPYRDIYQSGAIHVAQAFGVPIVASAIGAMQDVVEHDVSGALVAAEDTAALAQTITALIADPERAKRLGQRALQDAEGPFAWTTIARTILDAV